MCDLETSRMGAPYIYDISHLRVKELSREFFYNLVNGLVLDPRPHTDGGNGRTDGQTNERGCHIKLSFLLCKQRLEF